MTFITTDRYSYRKISDLQNALMAIRFIFANFILVFIFIFLTLEVFEWEIFSSREGITDKTIDETPWNIKALF